MTLGKAQAILASLFLIFFAAIVVLVAVSFLKGEIYANSVGSVFVKVLTIYSVQLAVIAGGIFGRHTSQPGHPSLPAFWTAFGLASTWNLLLMWRFAAFTFSAEDVIGSVITYLDSVAPASSFLVSGALAFFFAKRR